MYQEEGQPTNLRVAFQTRSQLVMQFEKNICVFFEKKNMFFSHKKIGLQKKKNTQKVFYFSKYSFKRNYKITVA